MTQRGFAGNEEWLADFRGGWGRSAIASRCSARSARSRRRAASRRRPRRAELEPGELPAALAELATRRRPAVLVRRGRAHRARRCPASPRRPATSRCEAPATDVLCVTLPPGADLGGRAREPRTLAAAARLDGRRPAARGGRSREAGCELALPYRPALDRADPEPFVRAFERAFCAPGRAAAGAYFAPAARSRSPAGRIRGRSTRRSRDSRPGPSHASGACGCRATACSPPTGRATAGRPGATAARARGRSRDGRIERLVLRFDPAVPRMVAA